MAMLHVGVVLQEDLKLVDMTNPFFVASLKRGIQAFRLCVYACMCACVCVWEGVWVGSLQRLVVTYDQVPSLHTDCVAAIVTTSKSQL